MKNYRLYLIRHGITQGNLDGIYMGSGTDQPLCAEGVQRLEALKGKYRYPDVNTVFSSPMQRAIETAEILFPFAKDKIILEDLRETDFGEFEGQKMTDLLEDEAFKRWMDPTQHFTPNGGERAEDFHQRCRHVLMGMLEYMMKAGVEKAACVTHGGVIMSMLAQCGPCLSAARRSAWQTPAAATKCSAVRKCGCVIMPWSLWRLCLTAIYNI